MLFGVTFSFNGHLIHLIQNCHGPWETFDLFIIFIEFVISDTGQYGMVFKLLLQMGEVHPQ